MVRNSRWIVGAGLVLFAVLSAVQPVAAQAPSTFTLQPGGRAVVTFEAFCTEFGEVFPTKINLPDGVVTDPARAALSYGVGKGLNATGEQALQLEYAIWQAIGTTNSPKGDATAQDVVTNGKTVPANPQGTSVVDAAKANQIKLTLDSFQPIGNKVQITPTASDNFYGRGQITIENTSQQALTLFMPVGTRFPSTDAKQQTLAGYATDAKVTNPQTAPAQLPATGGSETSIALLAGAFVLLGLGLMARSARRRV